jgi:SAM-dependent methyltransferase
MNRLKTIVTRALLLALLAPWPGAVLAQAPQGAGAAPQGAVKQGTATPAPALDDPVARQERIYRSQGKDVPEGYVISRGLADYSYALSGGFTGSLAALGSNDRWLDIGAGEGRAILDYYTPGYDATRPRGPARGSGKARAVAMSIEDRRTAQWHDAAARLDPGTITYLSGKSLRGYKRDELGRFQLITDVIGGFSYVRDLSYYMERALDLLEVGGTFYTVLQDVHAEDGWNSPYYEGSPFLTEIQNTDGSKMKICAWLKRISCVAVTCELTARMRPPVELYRIHKTCDDVSVPALLPVHYEAGTPPERRYQPR